MSNQRPQALRRHGRASGQPSTPLRCILCVPLAVVGVLSICAIVLSLSGKNSNAAWLSSPTNLSDRSARSQHRPDERSQRPKEWLEERLEEMLEERALRSERLERLAEVENQIQFLFPDREKSARSEQKSEERSVQFLLPDKQRSERSEETSERIERSERTERSESSEKRAGQMVAKPQGRGREGFSSASQPEVPERKHKGTVEHNQREGGQQVSRQRLIGQQVSGQRVSGQQVSSQRVSGHRVSEHNVREGQSTSQQGARNHTDEEERDDGLGSSGSSPPVVSRRPSLSSVKSPSESSSSHGRSVSKSGSSASKSGSSSGSIGVTSESIASSSNSIAGRLESIAGMSNSIAGRSDSETRTSALDSAARALNETLKMLRSPAQRRSPMRSPKAHQPLRANHSVAGKGDAQKERSLLKSVQVTSVPQGGAKYFVEVEGKVVMDGILRRISSGERVGDQATPLGAYMKQAGIMSHASNLLVLPDGELLCVWFSGEVEGGNAVAIVISRLPLGSMKWSDPVVASKEIGRSAQNPVLFFDRSFDRAGKSQTAKEEEKTGKKRHGGILTLLHTSQEAYKGQSSSEIRVVHSLDHGYNWTRPRPMFTEPGSFTKNQLLRSIRGEWLLPLYYTPGGAEAHSLQYSAIKRSKDGGFTWDEGTMMRGTKGKLVQPSVVRLRHDGILVAYFRSRGADYIYESRSFDDGYTWTKPRRTKLPNNNSGIQALVLSNGHLVIVFNNIRGPHGRWPLSIALSEDEGETWPFVRDLEPWVPDRGDQRLNEDFSLLDWDDDEPGVISAEYSYPSVVQSHVDDLLHISYTWRRKTIRHVRVTEDWIRRGSTVGEYQGGREMDDEAT